MANVFIQSPEKEDIIPEKDLKGLNYIICAGHQFSPPMTPSLADYHKLVLSNLALHRKIRKKLGPKLGDDF